MLQIFAYLAIGGILAVVFSAVDYGPTGGPIAALGTLFAWPVVVPGILLVILLAAVARTVQRCALAIRRAIVRIGPTPYLAPAERAWINAGGARGVAVHAYFVAFVMLLSLAALQTAGAL